jgi:HK97 gp10 family phage protein
VATIFKNAHRPGWTGKSTSDWMVVEGGEELRAKLMALAKGIDVDLAEEAMLEAGDPMRARAAGLAPRAAGPGHGKGGKHLADNIILGAQKQEPGAANVAVGPSKDVWYGLFWEFGTRWIAAHPFLRPAFDVEEAGTVKRWGERMWQEIQELAGSAEG